MAQLDLSLRLRANADGSLSVINATTRDLNALSNASDRANQSAHAQRQSFNQLAAQTLDLSGAFRVAAGGLSILAALAAGKEIITLADNIRLAESRIRVSTQSTNDFVLANKALLDISLKTHTELASNQLLFARTNTAIEAMGGSIKNTLAFNELLAKSLKLSGATASETTSIVRQMSQALASGQLRGDELNSVAENGFRLAQAIRDGLGITMGEMRKQAEQGLLTSDRVFTAILSQYQKINEEAKKLPLTVEMALTDVQTQFGQYIHSANTAYSATERLAHGIEFVGENIAPILNTGLALGEVLVTALALNGVKALVSYGQAQLTARTQAQAAAQALAQETAITQAHSEALLQNNILNAERTVAQQQAALANAQQTQSVLALARAESLAQLQATNATIRRAEATIAATSATVQNTSVLYIQRQAEAQLAQAQSARTAIVAELATLGQQQARVSAEITAAEAAQTAATNTLTAAQTAQADATAALAAQQAAAARAANIWANGMTYVNAAFSGLIGFELGGWLNQFSGVANYAIWLIGRWDKNLEQLGYRAEQVKAVLTLNFGNLDAISAAHQRQAAAIDGNVSSIIEWRDKLQKANLTEQEYKDLQIQLKPAQDVFKEKTLQSTKELNAGVISLTQYIEKIGKLRDQLDAASNNSLSAYAKEVKRVNDEIYKLTHSDAQNQRKQAESFTNIGEEQDQLTELYGKLASLQEQQKQQKAETRSADKAERKDEKDHLKYLETAYKAYADSQIKNIERVAAAQKFANSEALKQLEFDYRQNNVGLQSFLAEKTRLIQQATQIELAQLESQKQSITSYTTGLEKVHAAIRQIESANNPGAVSSAGAIGLMQIMPSTLKSPGLGMKGMDVGGLTDNSNKEQLRAFAIKYADELRIFGEEYFDRLLKRYNGDLNKAAAAYNMGFAAFEKAGMKPNNTETINYVNRFNKILSEGSQERIDSSKRIIELTDQQNQLYQKQQSDLAELNRFAITENAQYAQSLEQLKLRYIELTGTAEQAFLARQRAESQPLLDKATANNDTGTVNLINQVNTAELNQFRLDHAQAYKQQLLDIKSATKDIGITSSEAFDVIKGGLGDVVRAFNSYANELDKINQQIAETAEVYETAKNKQGLTDQERAGLAQTYAQNQIELESKKTQATLKGYGQMLGSAKSLFKEQSAGYKALTAAEKVFRAFEMAEALRSFATKQQGVLQWLGIDIGAKQASLQAEQATVQPSIAASQAKGQAKAAEGVATQGGAGPYIGFALMAAMAVMMASLGFNTGLSGSASLSQRRQEEQGTGTVFGDVAAKSESISNALETMKDVDLATLPLTQQMATSLRNIEGNIAGLSNLLIQANIANPDSSLSSTSYNAYKYGGKIINAAIGGLFGGPIGAFLGNEFGNALNGVFKTIDPIGSWLAENIFGKTSVSVQDTGLFIPDQNIASIKSIGLLAQQYVDLKKETEYLFGLMSSSSNERRLSNLDDQTSDQLNKLILNIADTVQTAAGYLSGSTTDVEQRLNDFVLNIGSISLKDLKGEELTTALNNVFSKAADDIASAAFSRLVPFQQVGEGYFETLIRVASGVEQGRVALQSLNIHAVDYTQIIDKQGDVFAETVRQSVVAVESLNGVANGVGDIINSLDASGSDLLSTYKDLLAVRNLMAGTGLNTGALDATLIGSAGSISNLNSSLSAFQESFFSEEEKLTAQAKQMTIAFAKLNLALPASNDGFKALVQGIDTSTNAGKVLLGQVLSLSEGFNNLSQQAETVLKSYEQGITDAYDTAESLLKKQIDTYKGYADSLKKFSDSLVTGNLSTASNAEQYQNARTAFFDLKKTLATGTEDEKKAALGNLQTAAQAYLQASKSYNASGLGYIKDFANVQGVLASSISDSESKADIAQSQLDTLTDQLTQLGLIKTSVDDVTTAVNAVGIAIAGYEAFKTAQDASKVKTANEAAFDTLQQQRRQTYEASINANAGQYGESGARYEGMLGFSAGLSKNPFSATGNIDLTTGTASSAITTTAGGKYAGDVAKTLEQETFPKLAGSLGLVARKIQSIIGGTLPAINVKFGDDQEYGTGFFEYAFGSVNKRINTDQLPSIQRQFADDLTDYLADQLTNKAWQDAIKAVNYSSLAGGFTELAATIAKLKRPFVEQTYNPDKDYTKLLDGSHKTGLTKVPYDGYIAELHKDERVLTAAEAQQYPMMQTPPANLMLSVTMPAQPQADNKLADKLDQAVKLLEKVETLLKESNDHAAASVVLEQSGFKKLIENTDGMKQEQAKTNRLKRIHEKA